MHLAIEVIRLWWEFLAIRGQGIMRLSGISYVAVAILGALLPVSPSFAMTMTWQLQDVVFSGGGTLTGSFEYDSTATYPLNYPVYSISSSFSGITYTQMTSNNGGGGDTQLTLLQYLTGEHYDLLILDFNDF